VGNAKREADTHASVLLAHVAKSVCQTGLGFITYTSTSFKGSGSTDARALLCSARLRSHSPPGFTYIDFG
jgi:hypothetical protein